MATLQVGDATVGYAVEGSGVPLLLFHGTTMDRTAWDMVRPAMPAETYEFVLIGPGSPAHLDLDISLDITAHLASISAPSLVIGAVEDRWVDVSHSRAVHEAVRGSVLHELPAGHLVIQELAVEVAALMHDHITTAAGARS